VPDVPSDLPIERKEAEAALLLSKLHGTGAFLGVELDADRVLQFRREEGVFYTEILDKQSRSIEHCALNLPLAEQALRAAFRRENIKKVAGNAFIKWQHEQMA
jgi:hypothetical protein